MSHSRDAGQIIFLRFSILPHGVWLFILVCRSRCPVGKPIGFVLAKPIHHFHRCATDGIWQICKVWRMVDATRVDVEPCIGPDADNMPAGVVFASGANEFRLDAAWEGNFSLVPIPSERLLEPSRTTISACPNYTTTGQTCFLQHYTVNICYKDNGRGIPAYQLVFYKNNSSTMTTTITQQKPLF